MAPELASKRDIFDRVAEQGIDLFDRVELDPEEKAAYSQAMQNVIHEAISKLPIGEMISKAVEKVMTRHRESMAEAKEAFDETLEKTRKSLRSELSKIKEEHQEQLAKLKRKYDDLKTEMMKPRYEFGGFSPMANDLEIGPAGDGAWRIVKSGTDLVIQRKESGEWVTKGSFTP